MFIKFAHVTHRMNIMEWHTIVIYREMLKLTIVEITKARSYKNWQQQTYILLLLLYV